MDSNGIIREEKGLFADILPVECKEWVIFRTRRYSEKVRIKKKRKL